MTPSAGADCNCLGRPVCAIQRREHTTKAGEPARFFYFFDEWSVKQMTSKSKQLKSIRKNKKKANKANLKADQKRIAKNIALLKQE
jgi:hypothetical protein